MRFGYAFCYFTTFFPYSQHIIIPRIRSSHCVHSHIIAHGECEQFPSEIKTHMGGGERLPSGKFDTNELVLELTVFLRLRDSSASLEFHGFRDYLKQKD